MRLLKFFRKKKVENTEEKKEKVYGWHAIEEAFEKVYPGQTNPRHFGTLIKWKLGGSDPLDGISVYDGGDYYHFVTFGLSEVYEKVNENKSVSGYGMEFTLKLKKGCYSDEESELKGICGILQMIARFTFLKNELFLPFEYLYSGQKEGMDVEEKSNITGFITVPDTSIEMIDTVNGNVKFVEFIGVTEKEIEAIHKNEIKVVELYEKLKNDYTDFERQSVI